jgi:hypothetical protein
MCLTLVSGFLTMVTQQIHSLRWIGVRSFHFASKPESEVKTTRRSSGTSCSPPAATCVISGPPLDERVRFAASPGALRLLVAERSALPAAPSGPVEGLGLGERFSLRVTAVPRSHRG